MIAALEVAAKLCMFLLFIFQEMTPLEEEEKCQVISDEHSKQLHWQQTLRIEKEQMELFIKQAKVEEKKNDEEAEKVEMQVKKANRELSVAQDEAHLRGVVNTMVNNVAAGDSNLHSVVRTLSEFLSKLSWFTNVGYCEYHFPEWLDIIGQVGLKDQHKVIKHPKKK